jgi:hypothetical protein
VPGAPEALQRRPGALKVPGGSLVEANGTPGCPDQPARWLVGSLVEAIETPGCPDQPTRWLVVMAGAPRHEEWMLAECQRVRGYLQVRDKLAGGHR